MKKRWIGIYVENEVGVLAKITGLFSGKSYNLNSLTVGRTEDETISRMTISLTSDDQTFEQIKKQLNRSIEVIKVMDYTDIAIWEKELVYIKINRCEEADKTELFRIADVFGFTIIDYGKNTILLEAVQTETKNTNTIQYFQQNFYNRIEIVRGGSVAIEAVHRSFG